MRYFILSLILCACVCVAGAQNIYIVNSNSRLLSRVDLNTFAVDNDFAQIGLYGNHIAYHDGQLYVVTSGDNVIRVIDAKSGALVRDIYVEDSSNPYHIKIHNGFAYTTGVFTNKLYKINLADDTVNSIAIGTAPQGMLVSGDRMYVALTGFSPMGFETGKVAVVDLNTFTVINTITVPTNPQELIIDEQGYLHIVCTGDYLAETSVVAIVNTATGELIETIPFPQSFFVTIQYGADGMIYVGNGYGLGFAVYNPITFEVLHNATNTLFPGGQMLLYDSKYIYVLVPNNFFASTLQVYSHQHSLVQTVSLGVGSVAMCADFTVVSDTDIVQTEMFAINAYPNPFNPSTTIEFGIGNSEFGMKQAVTIDIYNVRGQKVRSLVNSNYGTGTHKVVWNGTDDKGRALSSGVYFYKVKINDFVQTKKVIMLK